MISCTPKTKKFQMEIFEKASIYVSVANQSAIKAQIINLF